MDTATEVDLTDLYCGLRPARGNPLPSCGRSSHGASFSKQPLPRRRRGGREATLYTRTPDDFSGLEELVSVRTV